MKLGLYASMSGNDDPPTLETVESYIDFAHELGLDVIDFRRDRGFASNRPDDLFKIKLRCLRRGLSIGYLASRGHLVGPDDQIRQTVADAREDVEVASMLGAPMLRLFTRSSSQNQSQQQREVHGIQEIADHAAERQIAVGLQNHPSTGDDILRILEQVDRPNVTYILDTGEWLGSPALNKGVPDPNIDFYKFMAQTAPHACHVRAKFHMIDKGAEHWLDYARIFRILTDAAFNGPITIVYEGKDRSTCDDKEALRVAARCLREQVYASRS